MIREEINASDFEFPFIIYYPTIIKENLPMIVGLHGLGEVGRGGKELAPVECNFPTGLFSSETFECIFVMPQCPPDSFWAAEIPNLYEFIHKLIRRYHVNEKRVSLTGLSMGGYGTWYLANRYPSMFAAIAPICGGGMTWRADLLDMSIWAFHGAADSVVPVSETVRMIDAVKKYGLNKNEVKMTIFENVDHDSWVLAYTADLIQWLLSKSR